MNLDITSFVNAPAPTFVAAAMDLVFDVTHQERRSVAVRGVAISPLADLASALTTMNTYGHDALPVVDTKGRVIGELRRAVAESYFPAAA